MKTMITEGEGSYVWFRYDLANVHSVDATLMAVKRVFHETE
jgi:hypothetical protein